MTADAGTNFGVLPLHSVVVRWLGGGMRAPIRNPLSPDPFLTLSFLRPIGRARYVGLEARLPFPHICKDTPPANAEAEWKEIVVLLDQISRIIAST